MAPPSLDQLFRLCRGTVSPLVVNPTAPASIRNQPPRSVATINITYLNCVYVREGLTASPLLLSWSVCRRSTRRPTGGCWVSCWWLRSATVVPYRSWTRRNASTPTTWTKVMTSPICWSRRGRGEEDRHGAHQGKVEFNPHGKSKKKNKTVFCTFGNSQDYTEIWF